MEHNCLSVLLVLGVVHSTYLWRLLHFVRWLVPDLSVSSSTTESQCSLISFCSLDIALHLTTKLFAQG